nr:MAG TPA: hypothetical protein [Caudoviricetes sp.]
MFLSGLSRLVVVVFMVCGLLPHSQGCAQSD